MPAAPTSRFSTHPFRPGLFFAALLALVCARAEAGTPITACSSAVTSGAPESRLIVIGFMGGHVRATNFIHREAQVARDLQTRFPTAITASVFANRNGDAALATVLHLLNASGCPTAAQKSSARVVIFGHSWGASETVALAKRLNGLAIPVLLTVQVDSVQKLAEQDGFIPPNVKEAVNFYQSDGLLHGRVAIRATDPTATTILGNFKSSYRTTPVAVSDFPWFARAFMKAHIEIENDPVVWDKVEALIAGKVFSGQEQATAKD